ncbi:histidine kinase [Parageobacillus genomosp. 1]|uniref:histidine kinase n=2 Tax=Parageobacillus genomosp. 1 TaxID=1295642 RepID=A0ABC9VFT4_9BACL|nr:histidine kinase [Parageobacillus genomosp. 1]
MNKGKTMHERLLMITILIMATAFFGEMKINPFDSPFRFSLGGAVFFFGLVSFTAFPPLVIGICAGCFVVIFRVLLDLLTGQAAVADSFFTHAPAACYYISFALIVSAVRFRRLMEMPIRAGVLGAGLDFFSNTCELFVRYLLGEPFTVTDQSMVVLVLFAILRSFCVIGVYNMLVTKHFQSLAEARKQELERLLMVNTGMYEETFYLQKSMQLIEEITRKSYELYSFLIEGKKVEPHAALYIAEHIHEVKKDMQRVFAGLSKLIGRQPLQERLPIDELCGMVIRANEKYAEMTGKTITFTHTCPVDLSTDHVYPLLSVLNNLVANAVEAIPSIGAIHLHAQLQERNLVIEITDTGTGIAKEDAAWIFQPGFTTKYDSYGNPSTGIGLTHARDIVQSFSGHIELVKSKPGQTVFRLTIPTDQLLKKGGK